jgi:CDP-diacylglycerol--serine O-phosphatidyltransferase
VNLPKVRIARRNSASAPRSRSVYLLPNLFTSASLFCAILSIVKAGEGEWVMACYLILAAAVCDTLDGPVARLTRSASSFGLQYDSLADVVAFGVAPAIVVYRKLQAIGQSVELHDWAPNLAIGACSLYAICGAIRLARFNVQVTTEERKVFTGLPIPGAACVVVAGFLFIEKYLTDTPGLHRLILAVMLVLAGLMVSTIPFPKLAALMKGKQRDPFALVTFVSVVMALVIFWTHLPAIVLVATLIYLVYSLGLWIRRAAAAPAPSADAIPRRP